MEVDNTKRKIKSYMVYEMELDHIGTLDSLSTIFGSIGGIFASLWFGLVTDLFVQGTKAAGGRRCGAFLEWTFGPLASSFVGISIARWVLRGSERQKTKQSAPDD